MSIISAEYSVFSGTYSDCTLLTETFESFSAISGGISAIPGIIPAIPGRISTKFRGYHKSSIFENCLDNISFVSVRSKLTGPVYLFFAHLSRFLKPDSCAAMRFLRATLCLLIYIGVGGSVGSGFFG